MCSSQLRQDLLHSSSDRMRRARSAVAMQKQLVSKQCRVSHETVFFENMREPTPLVGGTGLGDQSALKDAFSARSPSPNPHADSSFASSRFGRSDGFCKPQTCFQTPLSPLPALHEPLKATRRQAPVPRGHKAGWPELGRTRCPATARGLCVNERPRLDAWFHDQPLRQLGPPGPRAISWPFGRRSPKRSAASAWLTALNPEP